MRKGRILQVLERMEGRIIQLDEKIDIVNQDLKEFKEETRNNFKLSEVRFDTIEKRLDNFKEETRNNFKSSEVRFDTIEKRLGNFEEETRDNFVSMSQMNRYTNERIIEIGNKMEEGFKKVYKAVGTAFDSAFASIDKNYVKIKDIS